MHELRNQDTSSRPPELRPMRQKTMACPPRGQAYGRRVIATARYAPARQLWNSAARTAMTRGPVDERHSNSLERRRTFRAAHGFRQDLAERGGRDMPVDAALTAFAMRRVPETAGRGNARASAASSMPPISVVAGWLPSLTADAEPSPERPVCGGEQSTGSVGTAVRSSLTSNPPRGETWSGGLNPPGSKGGTFFALS